MKHIAGVTVSATTIEAMIASAYAVASGVKNAPVSPERKNTGSRAIASMSDAYTIELRTSSEASSTILAVESGASERRFSRSLRTMFSQSTIASSTTAPVAITKPASTIVLIV